MRSLNRSKVARAGCAAIALLALLDPAGDTRADPPPGTAPEAPWSATSNGVRARLSMRRGEVLNGTGIVWTYLEIENVGDLMSPLLVRVEPLQFRVTDAVGRDVPVSGGPGNGPVVTLPDLVLPHDASLRTRLPSWGWGVPGDQAAYVSLGVKFFWVLPNDGKAYFLDGTLEVPSVRDDREGGAVRWEGRLDLPRVRIPTAGEPADPATLGPRIDDLGSKMLASDRFQEGAQRELSLIDDPRVIPWYVKAVHSDSYSLRFAALDRLSRLPGDEALSGIEVGMRTQGEDLRSRSTPDLAAKLAENVRHAAAGALARSSHPRARALLWTMEDDAARSVRLTVLQTAARLESPEADAILERRTRDDDPLVRGEAVRLLEARRSGGK